MLDAVFCFITGLLVVPLGGMLQLSILALFSKALADHKTLTPAQERWRSTWLRLMAIGLSLGLFCGAMLIADNVPIPLADFASGVAGIALTFILLRWLFQRVENSPATDAGALGSSTVMYTAGHDGGTGTSDCGTDSGSSAGCDGGRGGDGGGGGGD